MNPSAPDSQCIIRRGTAADLDAVMPMWVDLYQTEKQAGMAYALRADAARVWRDEAARRIGTPNFLLFVAESNANSAHSQSAPQELAGFIVGQIRRRPAIYADPVVGSLTELYVKPSYRGHKLASRLVTTVLDAFRERGLPFADALPVAGNEPSLKLWKALGWQLDLVQYRRDLRS